MTDLRVLRLEGNTISPEAAEELAKALKQKKTLERFIGNDLFTGRLKDEIPLALRSMCGAIDISGAKLVEINMSDNAFGPIGLEALMEFFQSGCCHSLQELRLHNNGLGPQGAQKLAHSLENGWRKSGEKMSLKVFVCGRNRLEYDGTKSISNTLGLIGTLEEIQMPQNGIRPNAIEFVAKACANNPQLKTINMNDNTFRSVGAEWMAKALSKLKNLKYINFGDCLLKSRGSLVLTRALVQSSDIKEIILSFNEISLDAGLQIAQLIAKGMNNLQLLDLNGNKFGDDGRSDVLDILKGLGEAVSTMSEDEGEDDEDEEESDAGEPDSGDSEDNSEVVVDGEEDYDEMEDYEEYDEDEEEDEEAGEEEEEEEYEEDEEEEEDYGSSNIAPRSTLFKPFNNIASNNFQLKPSHPIVPHAEKSNLFTSMVINRYLKTNSVPAFDNFVNTPDMNNLKSLDDSVLNTVSQLEQFDAKFLTLFLHVLSKLYEANSGDAVLACASTLIQAFFKKQNKSDSFSDAFLIQFGFLKSEEKNFAAFDLSDKLALLLANLVSKNLIPRDVKENIVNYIKLRNDQSNGKEMDEKFKKNSHLLFKSLS